MIEDYAIIGNFESAALVSRDGSIDWLCFPSFDSPACFARLLGDESNGYWSLRPAGPASSRRAYREETLVLETEHRVEGGTVLVIDAMIPGTERPTLIRLVQGVEGRVAMRMQLSIRFDYGSIIPWVTRDPFGALRAVAGPESLRLHTTAPMRGENLTTVADFEIGEGEEVPFVMVWSRSHEEPPRMLEYPRDSIDHCATTWREWAARCVYQGSHSAAVKRSLITLKALSYEPTGGMVAGATTSLPERIGGTRNWDYRFCWVRDSTFTLYALLTAGYREEARRWKEWLLRAVAGTPEQVRVMYGLHGERRLVEMELPWLAGYEGSSPVRVGNAAHLQLQMDVFGELMDSFHVARQSGLANGGTFDSWRVEAKLIDYIREHWRDPDNGIWEVRGPLQHFTHSKVMAWVAVDRAARAVEEFGLEGDAVAWRALADEIHEEVCHKAFNRELNSFTQAYGSKALDASLLMLSLVGFLPPDDPRILGTVAAIERELMHDGFVRRYVPEETDDGVGGAEGVFLACTLWLADNYCLQGRLDEATRILERVLEIANDVGLLSEEYDPAAKQLLGNFPQAFSHVGVINTAFNIARAHVGPAEKRSK